jgi:aldehyde dehydrogenase (NAD(P)+)
MLKMNPANEYLGPIFEQIFVDYIDAGYLAIVYGGANAGAFLVNQPGIETIHLTGSARTYQTIVYGDGSEGLERLQNNKPIMKKPITSELGGVTPVIVIPGPWSEADIDYQAQNIVTMKLQNSGYNCIAAQVLILPESWDLSAKLLAAIRKLMQELPERYPYYPGSADRQQAAIKHHPNAEQLSGEVPRTLITNLDPTADNEFCFREELFGETLVQVNLPGDTPSEYLHNAVTFCNSKLQGTLGANIIVHPKSAKMMGPTLEVAVDNLEYGSVSLNIWAAAAFLLAQAAWGGHPSETNQKSQSGAGVVHNSFMFDKPQKTVVRASFYPFPRSFRHGEFHIAPKPPWFVTHKTAHITSRRVAWLTADRNPIHLPGIFISTLRG